MEPLLWIVLGAALAIAELFTTTLFLIMFSVGAFAAAGAAALGAPVSVQALVFAVVSVLTVLLGRPGLQRRRLAQEDGEGRPFGAAAIEGQRALVLERVDTDSGQVKIDGELWSARSFDATQVFEPGERVQVIEVRGVTALVWRDDFSASGELPES
ncbi:NfeD family protein [Plantactinospora sp. KBS50]|uniref:NfeD family protein n=1 Tax=Plantactinospora sp. KBS50 TaxID=2024580 RepID=UPI000BAAA864|nr:NfeD family protein [Plantactinospora sp. KBS50]ASW55855.1 activity regulator of membrane protease YbbK [Plantactinospora sp. KBS50]